MRSFARFAYIWGVFWRFRLHIACALVALGLWDTTWIKPFRIFVVVVHELCHAVAALLTGGQVIEVRAGWDESGHTLTQGGIFPLVSAAGYVGSAALGALLIYAGLFPRLQRLLLAAMGGACLLLSVRFIPFGGSDFYLGIGGGAALLVLALYFRRAASAVAVWMGVMLCLYSLYDFRTDLWLHPERTDAGILARYWGLPLLAYPIALGWVLISLSFMYRALRALARRRDW